MAPRLSSRLAASVVAAAVSLPAVAQPTSVAANLADLSLEQLGNIVVLSVSRREESLAEAPASIYVITNDEIRRAGVTSLPEALRLAPNLIVARADANQYAISARGFNNVLANKLLVMIDGRTVYTPLFSGVFWEAQDVMLEDIERIEVVSGPGATLWGANAVNGVINIITRGADKTQGFLVSGGAGNTQAGAALRYGGALPNGGHYRVYAKYFDLDSTTIEGGGAIRDASKRGQVGFRADWAGPVDTVTVQGDAYRGEIDQNPSERKLDGANLLGRWMRKLADGAFTRVQAYWDYTHREHPQQFEEHLDTLDVEAQYGFTAGAHEILVGGGYRYARDRVVNTASQAFLPPDKSLSWSNVFAQDRIQLAPTVDLTLGAKLEHNDYTGVEFLPSVRLSWQPTPAHMLWTAASRAVRAPSRIDRDVNFPGAPPFVLVGNDTFGSEIANVYEIGYRAQPTPSLSYNVTVFHHDYSRLRSLHPTTAGLVFANAIEGRTTGVEAWGIWRVLPAWRLSAGVMALRERLEVEGGSTDTGLSQLGNDPAVQWQVRSTLDLAYNQEVDIAVRHVGALPEPTVRSYTALDARWAWRPRSGLEVSVVGRNLADPRHVEWGNRGEIPRSFFANVRWSL
ncbi:MAG TPA: TonB-dependent receptor [Casimicrobiaceae bacterium]|jgi:iron complex outermembrane receptor protein